ncbi:DNA glycosylase [Phellopilus nigrolimitatus]|nr:DNA glycosylase [Phellopilus nigrolimitatus]
MSSSIPVGFKSLHFFLPQLSLSAVLKCGQSFRWAVIPLVSPVSNDVPTHEYRLCLKDRVVCLRQTSNTLFYRSFFAATTVDDVAERKNKETRAFIQDYFQLDTDLLGLYDAWSVSDPVFKTLRDRFSGIRMLRQDPWECLISFICSSNNNISRISKMVQNLCTHFSPPLATLDDPLIQDDCETGSCTYHPFPPPSVLAASSVSAKLRGLGFGYRADFIQKTAAMLIDEHGSDAAVFQFLAELRNTNTESARAELLKLMGVGRKVADCVLLMSLDKPEVVPVDTHVHQIAVKYYGMRGAGGGKMPMTPKLYNEVNARLVNIWGDYAGWAHSILFTADLKSFSTYGLPTPSPSVSPQKSSITSRPTIASSDAHFLIKRKKTTQNSEDISSRQMQP